MESGESLGGFFIFQIKPLLNSQFSGGCIILSLENVKTVFSFAEIGMLEN